MRLLPLLMLAACSAPYRAAPPEAPSPDDRALARTAQAEVHREKPEEGPPAAAALAKQRGGWVKAMTAESVVLAVPDEQLEDVLRELDQLGSVKSRKLSAANVADAQGELEARIGNLTAARDRYLALLEKAQNVAEAAVVERELERVTGQLELLEAQQKALEQRVQFAALSVQFGRDVRPGPVGWVFYGLFSGVKWLLVWD